jgi:hypothetical protein
MREYDGMGTEECRERYALGYVSITPAEKSRRPKDAKDASLLARLPDKPPSVYLYIGRDISPPAGTTTGADVVI